MDVDTLQRENERLHKRISRLCAASLRINASRSLGTALRDILRDGCELTGARYGLLNTINEAGLAEAFATSGFTQEEEERLRRWPDMPRLFECFRDVRGVVSFADLSAATRSLIASAGLLRAQTYLCTPLHHREKYVGNFLLMGKRDGGEFTNKNEEVHGLFTSLAAMAIANACTHREERRAHADLEALVDTAPVGVVVFSADVGSAMLFNREAKRLVEDLRMPYCSYQQLLEDLSVQLPDGREFSLREVAVAHELENSELLRGEQIELSVEDGRSVSVLLSATPIRSSDGVIESVVVTLQDLEPFRELDRSRAKFISMVSHELGAPLTSIKGCAASALRASRPLYRAEILQFFRIIDGHANHMHDLIGDLLDIGRIDTGTLTVDPEPWSLVEIVERARTMFLSKGSGHAILVDLPSRLPQVMADSLRIVQVLNNLFANAAKHSPEHAPISVVAKHVGSHIAVSVVDEGAGIAQERLPYLFQKHAGPSSNEQQELRGGGLGLAICKGLVEALGGRIQAFSDGVGQGTRITFTIPVAEQSDSSGFTHASGTPGASYHDNGKPLRVLVVDDDPNLLRLIRETLTTAGYDVIITANHLELSRIIRQRKPQLVLLDLMLPGTDGVDLINSIPELADLPIIFISGYRKDDTIARALDAGAVDYIVKPFSPTELKARIRAALRRHAKPEPLVLGNLAIDYEKRRVTVSGRLVQLTAKEFDLLRVLSFKPGRVLKHNTLIRAVWGDRTYAHAGLVRSHIVKLRRKLRKAPDQPDFIINVYGVGYKMASPDEL